MEHLGTTGIYYIVSTTGIYYIVSSTGIYYIVSSTGIYYIVSSTGIYYIVSSTGIYYIVSSNKYWQQDNLDTEAHIINIITRTCNQAWTMDHSMHQKGKHDM